MHLSEPYRPRPIRFLELWRIDDWRLKAYAITYGDAVLADALLDAARHVVQHRLRLSATQTRHYGVGFVGIHQGKTGNFVFVDWWAQENELHHHVYVSPSKRPGELDYLTPTGLAACTWDLFLINHERNAWVAHVMQQHDAPDIDGYLTESCNAYV